MVSNTGIARELVLVEWEDSCGAGRDWSPLDQATAKALPCRSVGWMVAESESALLLVPHLHDSDEELGVKASGCGELTIPRRAVKRIAFLRETEWKPSPQ
jgi:hypothetical protein